MFFFFLPREEVMLLKTGKTRSTGDSSTTNEKKEGKNEEGLRQ